MLNCPFEAWELVSMTDGTDNNNSVCWVSIDAIGSKQSVNLLSTTVLWEGLNETILQMR